MTDAQLLAQLSPRIREFVEAHDRLALEMAQDVYLAHAENLEAVELNPTAMTTSCAEMIGEAWKDQTPSPELIRLVSERMAFKFYQRTARAGGVAAIIGVEELK